MAATDLGKVGIVMKGTWSNVSAYEALDAVSYDNVLYIAKTDVPAGTPVSNTTYWQVAMEQLVTSYSKASITLEYSANVGTQPTYTLQDASAIYGAGKQVTYFLWFHITDVGNGSALRVFGLPVLPKGSRTLTQVSGNAVPAGAFGHIDKPNSFMYLFLQNGQQPSSSSLTAGELYIGVSFITD